MSESAAVVTPPTMNAWMAEVPTERPEKVEPVKVEVVESKAAPVEAESGAAEGELAPASGQPSNESAPTRDADTGKFTSKARQEMQKRIDTLTAKIKGYEAKQPQPASIEQTAPSEVSPAPLTPYGVAMPKLEDFSRDADPYEAYIVAKAEWNIERKAFERTQVQQRETAQRDAVDGAYAGRVESFIAETPDFHKVIDESPIRDMNLGPVLYTLIKTRDNGPQVLYYLAQHADETLDLLAVYGEMPATERTLDIVQKKLALRLASVPRGSEAGTPVRTNAPPPAGRLGAGTRTTTERAIDLAAKGGEDFDASGYAVRRREELKARR